MPCRIIGLNHNDTACARRNGLFESVKVNLPAMIVNQGISHELYVLNLGEETEERVTGDGNYKLVPRIAEYAKRKCIGLAGARRENNVLHRTRDASFAIVRGHCPASVLETFRIRFVGKSGWVAERAQDLPALVGEAAVGWVRDAQIKQGEPGSAVPGEGFAQAIDFKVPVGAVGKLVVHS